MKQTNLQTRRRAAGVTLDDLSQKSGLDTGYLSRVERGFVSRPELERKLDGWLDELIREKIELLTGLASAQQAP
jgi:transcriptional regulator with XRE-family HTH domain